MSRHADGRAIPTWPCAPLSHLPRDVPIRRTTEKAFPAQDVLTGDHGAGKGWTPDLLRHLGSGPLPDDGVLGAIKFEISVFGRDEDIASGEEIDAKEFSGQPVRLDLGQGELPEPLALAVEFDHGILSPGHNQIGVVPGQGQATHLVMRWTHPIQTKIDGDGGGHHTLGIKFDDSTAATLGHSDPAIRPRSDAE